MAVSGKFMLDLVNLAHPSTTKQTDNAVLAEARAGLKTVVGIAHESILQNTSRRNCECEDDFKTQSSSPRAVKREDWVADG